MKKLFYKSKNSGVSFCQLYTVNCTLYTNQSGQLLIVLVLVMLTILTVGLIIIQRSTVDVTTSTQNEQSTRAFSAAEAGIEKALQSNLANGGYDANPNLTNNSAYTVTTSARLPLANQGLEYPAKSKGDPAQFWLIRPDADLNAIAANYDFVADPSAYALYKKDGIYVYFGDRNSTDLAAVEINLITFNLLTRKIENTKAYVDADSSRGYSNNFYRCESGNLSALLNPPAINTSVSPNGTGTLDRQFKCRVRVNTLYNPGSNIIPVMLRTRFLYVDNQPVAAVPEASGYSLPQQQTIFTSIGTSGLSRKTIQVIKEDNESPYFFDYAIFAVSDIAKTN